ncbi:MAG: ROK family protein [Bacteroidales bacterium]|jgi:glucokinase|nr:ROK family protein [Bacteroidales bacterium]
MAVIGIDLGGTKISAALLTRSGETICNTYRLLEGATGSEVGRLIAEAIRDLRSQNNQLPVEAVGVCVPGIVYSKKGTVWAPNIPGWDDYPLLRELEAAVGDPTVRIALESDRTCYILGEVWKGAARGCTDAIYLAVGTGIGAGILLDGRVIHGASDIVGATGWMALETPWKDEYKPVGCFEYYASGNGIGTQAKLRYGDPSKTSYDVFAGYGSDPVATEILDHAIQLWGMGTANLVSLFNPQKVIFGGGVFGPAVRFIDRIYEEACRWGQPISMRDVRFCASEVGGDAALLGAAYLAVRETENL